MSYDLDWRTVGDAGEPQYENGFVKHASDPIKFMKTGTGIFLLQGIFERSTNIETEERAFILPSGYYSDHPRKELFGAGFANSELTTSAVFFVGSEVRPQVNGPSVSTKLAVNIAIYIGPAELAGIKGDKGDRGYQGVTGEGFDAPGVMKAYGGDVAPLTYAMCFGQELNRITEAHVFAVIGIKYGAGDGVNTFNVPDWRGLFLRGAGEHGSMKKANGNPYDGGSVGGESNDKGQDHIHEVLTHIQKGGAGSTGSVRRGLDDPIILNSGLSKTDGVNGPIRAGDENNPAYGAVNWIIKL